MEQKQIEVLSKVFTVVGGKRKCLICDGVFTPRQAANHATAPCHSHGTGRETVPATWDA